MASTALIIDDEPDIRELIALTLSRMDIDTHTAANLEEARELLSTYEFDVCLTDMRLPDGNGVEFVKYIQDQCPALPVAVITAHGNMEAAIEAMKNGAYDFVSKPVDINLLRRLVVQAVAANDSSANEEVDQSASETNDAALERQPEDQTSTATKGVLESASLENLSGRTPPAESARSIAPISSDRLIGQSPPMQELRLMIAKVARTNAPVWITGESGTGKELIAKLIHENSPRANAAFVAINCGAIPSELMESELFGHKKGSFTGASSDHDGLFRRADGGTLFLDEVAELPLHMQVKLLRAIQERSVRAVGGNDELPVDVRILSASHKDLASEVDAGSFRHDLYYRLNVISLKAPSLRDRPGDVSALTSHILERLSSINSPECLMMLSSDALNKLQQYHFPGNVRELENLLERAIAMADGSTIGSDDLLLQEPRIMESTHAAGHLSSNESKVLDECAYFMETLNATRWNRRAAAEKMGLTYRQFRYRLKQLGIEEDK